MRRPSLVMRSVSKCSTTSPRLRASRTRRSSSCRSGGMMIVIGRPSTSAEGNPNRRSAAGFQDVMMPSSVLPTMTSSAPSTMAASRLAARWPASASRRAACADARRAIRSSSARRRSPLASLKARATSTTSAGPRMVTSSADSSRLPNAFAAAARATTGRATRAPTSADAASDATSSAKPPPPMVKSDRRSGPSMVLGGIPEAHAPAGCRRSPEGRVDRGVFERVSDPPAFVLSLQEAAEFRRDRPALELLDAARSCHHAVP